MPVHRNVADVRLTNIKACLTPAVALLNELHDVFSTPFILAITNSTLALIAAVQGVKRNKEECIRLMENIHGLLYAIVNLHIRSQTTGSLPPAVLHHLGELAETLHRIQAFVESSQEGNMIKHFFRQGEMNALLENCRAGLHQAEEIEAGVTIFDSIAEMEEKTQAMQKELLELISGLSDGTMSDRASSLFLSSSNSFSMLPAKPKIFHGRDSELSEIVNALNQGSPRIAILGAGGMGKTSLARAVLHHPETTAKYEQCVFVPCDSATTSLEVAAQIGMHIALKPGKDLTKPVVQYFSRKGPCLLILDNLETSWEPKESRSAVEELLSLLTDIPRLALLITMRGAERPAKVRWTRPFLPPLKPFEDITELLNLTDNMPLAVDLIAHLVDYEVCSNILARWKTEKTSLLSDGYDRKSNLDASINISLSSPRITSCPGALDLLSLLSILPDGLSHAELVQISLPIPDILACKAALLSTSLAYSDDYRRLKSLVPIREHMQHFHPPTPLLIQPLRKHFHLLLDLYRTYQGAHETVGIINEITTNLGNLQHVLRLGLHPDNPDIADTIICAISLNSFSRVTGRGRSALMDVIPASFPRPCNHKLEVSYITEVFSSAMYSPISDPDHLASEGTSHCKNFDDPVVESLFYVAVGDYYLDRHNISAGLQGLEMALQLSLSSRAIVQQTSALLSLSRAKCILGDYHTAQIDARDAQRSAKSSGNVYFEARALFREASCYSAMGDYRNSSLLLHKGRELLRVCGMSGSNLDHNIMDREADVHLLKSEYAEARSIHTHILQSTSTENDAYMHALALLNITEIDVIIGADAAHVRLNLETAQKILGTVSFLRGLIYSEMILADLSLREGDIATAKPLFQKCLNSSWGNSAELAIYGLERLANGSRWTETTFDWTWSAVYLGYAKKREDRLALHKSLCFLGDVFLSAGDDETATNLFVVALEGFTYMDVHQGRADCMLRLGDVAKRRGDTDKAVELWKDARPLFERSLQAKDVARIDSRLASMVVRTG
ncbi:hypothetical protein FB451DRAFT_1236511 [Mycena latifolia]|nr:hypothetical protein FB451DRAFT_1236511 [Mycena latifolia]